MFDQSRFSLRLSHSCVMRTQRGAPTFSQRGEDEEALLPDVAVVIGAVMSVNMIRSDSLTTEIETIAVQS